MTKFSTLDASIVAAPLVSLRDAAVQLGGRTIWRDVTLDVAAGEFVAILGPNGVGKSTLLRATLGLIPIAQGTLQVGGVAPGRGSHDIGYLPQRRSFDASMRVRGMDVVRLGLDGDRWGLPLPRMFSAAGKKAATRVEETIALVGASDYAN